MRKVVAIGLVVVILAAIVSCSGTSVSEDEAKEAYLLSFVSVFSASIGLAFGMEVDGVTLDKETDELTFAGFNPSEFLDGEFQPPYTDISGTVTSENDVMKADLTLKGGPVKSISFTTSEAVALSNSGFTTTVTINGKEIEMEITEQDLGRL